MIPTTREVETGRITVEGQPGQKFSNTESQQTSRTFWSLPVIPASCKAIVGRLWFEPSLGQKYKTLSEK
jgi:hypothetical protein